MPAKKPTPPPEKTAEQIEYERKYGHPTSPPPPPKKASAYEYFAKMRPVHVRLDHIEERLARIEELL